MGDSLSAFLEKVGIPKGGGPRTRLREQMDRLFTAHFQLRYDDARGKSFISSQIADSGGGFWPLRELSALLRRGNRLAFRVASYGDATLLEGHGEQHPVAGMATGLVVSGGKFNNADISQNLPKQPKSLVGVIHRTLVNQGAKPKWTIQPNAYRGPFGRCDCLAVRI